MNVASFLDADAGNERKDVWTAVLGMSVVEFASVLSGGPRAESAAPTTAPAKRTRISDAQKNSIKGAIVSVLGQHKDGLSRTEIAGQIGDDVLATNGVKRDELASSVSRSASWSGTRNSTRSVKSD